MSERRPSDAHEGAVRLEFAAARDAAAIAALSRDLIEHGLEWTYRPARIAGYLGDADTVVLVARDGAALAGFAIMRFGDERAHLVLLAVAAARRRRGIARAMLDWLAASAEVAGIASMHVELRESNHAARRLYAAAGYEESLRVPRYYGGRETAIRMLKLLRAPAPRAP